MVGVDFSAGRVEAVAWAFSIAEKFNAGVTLVHVVDFAAGDVSSSYRQILVDGIHVQMKNLVVTERGGIPESCDGSMRN